MSNPGNAAAQSNSGGNAAVATEPTFEQQVTSVVGQMTKKDDGTFQIPDTVKASANVLYAAGLEKRRRDTESALGRSRAELKTEAGLRTKLEQRVAEQVRVTLAPDKQAELDQLKFDDPDAWRAQMNQLESEASTTLRSQLDEDRSSVSQEAELERRADVLRQFNATHSDAPVTDDALANDIPPRIVKRLTDGKISYEEFLQESHDFMVAPKKIGGKPAEAVLNLGELGGNSTPTAEASALQEIVDYNDTVF